MFASLISMGLYQFHQRIHFREVLARVAVGFILGGIALAVVFYAFPSFTVSRELSAVAVGYALILLLLVRYIFMRRLDENMFRRRTLVYGSGERASAIGDLRRKADRRGFKIIGSVPAPGDTQTFEKNGVLIREKSIDWLAEELDADEIVIAMDDRRGNLPVRDLLNAKLHGIDVIDLLEFLERESGKIRVDLVNPGWLIFSPGFRASRFRKFSKQTVDLLVSSLLLLVSWPVMLAITACIKFEDGLRASVLYRQRRVGYRGKIFNVLKFRSMIENAEADGQEVWAEENDERITRVGRVLRKFRLDELPQVFNVVRGQMSLVGPRPERPNFVAELSESIPYYSERHTVKPGVTGWAQLRYSYGSSTEDAIEKLHYDLYYVKNHNLLLDFIIILQTVEIILWGKGAR
jgi:sugar transferase (PEP-CTERM system associated)